MKRLIFALSALLLTLSPILARAQENPRWIRKNAISPDGRHIAFSYKGDIYVVGSEGGQALQLTSHSAYESDPIWSKDGKSVIFSSYREGSKDIFACPATGGSIRRITDYPGNEIPKATLPDGSILFVAALQADPAYDGFPEGGQLYAVSDKGGRPRRVTSLQVENLSVNAGGDVIYEDNKGYEDPFRKHHTSSVTRDIWLCTNTGNPLEMSAKSTFKKLTAFAGEDRNPVFAADGRTFYYLSEQDGQAFNVFRSTIDNLGAPVQLTFSAKNPIRYLSISDEGTLAYSLNGSLYTLREGEVPTKVDITLFHDESEREMFRMNLSSASAICPSPDGKEVALIIRGDVFVTSSEFKTTRRITNTPEQERGVSFSEDGRTLYYAAERDGHWAIWRSSLTDRKDKLFTYASGFKEERFSDAGETCFQPVVSPDGKWVAYLRDRTELVIKPTRGGKAKSLLKGANYSYTDGDQDFTWSPDSRFLLCNYGANGGWNNEDVAMVDIEKGTVTDLTRSGYSDGNFRWALKGKAMTWMSDKYGYRSHGSWGAHRDLFIMFFDPARMSEWERDKEDEALAKLLDEKAEKKEKKDSADSVKQKVVRLKPVLEGRENRIRCLTGSSTFYTDHYLSDDGNQLFYIAPLEKCMGLSVLDIKKGDTKVILRGVRGSITPSPDGKTLYVFSGGDLKKISTSSTSVEGSVSFSGEYEFKPKAEREYIFEHIWKQVKEKFYDPGLHGADWAYFHENYGRFLSEIDNYYDFQELLSEMLGELNGSHTGARFYARGGVSLGHLGILLDETHKQDGLKIAEVLPDGPLSLADPEIKAGDIILSIDGTDIRKGDNWMKLLGDKAGKKVALVVKKGGKTVRLYVKASSSDYDLLYRRWVTRREEMVRKLSGGRVGYVHVEGMNSPSFREVYSNALGKYRTCEALIVDTRHNGGGWLHDDLATFLSGKAYLEFRPRGQYIGTEPFNKWTKPSCVLIGEDNYSDACGFPLHLPQPGPGQTHRCSRTGHDDRRLVGTPD